MLDILSNLLPGDEVTRDQARLIVGLGNPGKDYDNTRHNLGFLVIHRLAQKHNLVFRKSSFTKWSMAEGKLGHYDLHCLLPLTYMNHSGIAVKEVVRKINMDHSGILVVCDDFNLDFGQIRIRGKGSDGGHNGLASIIEHLGTPEFARLRLGIGAPAKGQETPAYVLGKWTKEEQKHLDEFVDRAAECCLVWAREGIRDAMEQFNKKS